MKNMKKIRDHRELIEVVEDLNAKRKTEKMAALLQKMGEAKLRTVVTPQKMLKKQIVFKMTEDDHRLIKAFAQQKGMSIRTLVLSTIAEAIRKELEVY